MKHLGFSASLIAMLAMMTTAAQAQLYLGSMIGRGIAQQEFSAAGSLSADETAPSSAFSIVGGYELPLGKRVFVAGETYIDITDINFSHETPDFVSFALPVPNPPSSDLLFGGGVAFAGQGPRIQIPFEDIQKFSSNLQFGLNALFGVKFGKAAAYALVGAHFEYWEYEQRLHTVGNIFTDPGIAVATTKDDPLVAGFQVGVGGRYIFANNIGIRGEYRYSRTQADFDIGQTPDQETTFQNHKFGLGVTYHF